MPVEGAWAQSPIPIVPTPLPSLSPLPNAAVRESKRLQSEAQAKGLNSEADGGVVPSSGISAPALDLGAMRREEGGVKSSVDTHSLPVIEAAPREGMSAYLGQTLLLSAKVRPPEHFAGKVFYAWVLNGRVVCNTLECRIPLDGRLVDVGYFSLVFLAYNSAGSAMTRHGVRVVRGGWTSAQPFDETQTRREEPVAVSETAKVVDRKLLHGWAMEGNAVHAFPENVSVVGSVPRNLPWRGALKTGVRSVLKVVEPDKAEWFLLGASEVALSSDTNAGSRQLKLGRGSIRVHALKGAPGPKNGAFVSSISTEEASINLPAGNDVYIVRSTPGAREWRQRQARQASQPGPIPKAEQFSTRIVSISGVTRVHLAKPTEGVQNFDLPPGVELVVFEDGSVSPLKNPDSEIMESMMRKTLAPDALRPRTARKDVRADVNVSESLKKTQELLEREDYFEVLDTLTPLQSRSSEDVRIPYYMGLAYKGLYQYSEARKQFAAAAVQDTSFVDASWQLGLMELENKRWAEAKVALDEARDRMPSDDKRRAEYEYYAGVISYNLESDFSARNHFTRAALWEPDLDPALQASSGEFLRKLGSRKQLSFIIPMGVQWDGNALELPLGNTVPAGYPQKSLYRYLLGAVATYDPSPKKDAAGWYPSYLLSGMVARHSPSEFHAFNMVIPSFTANQTEILSAEGATEGWKLSEALNLPIMESKLQQVGLGANVGRGRAEAGLGVEIDTVSSSGDKVHMMNLRQAYGLTVWNVGNHGFDVDGTVEEKFASHQTETKGTSFALTGGPSYAYKLGNRGSIKLTVGGSLEKAFYGEKLFTAKALPNVSATGFVTPWLMLMGTGSYEYWVRDSEKIVRPGISVMASGIF